MGVTAGIFLASILLKELRYLVYIRYLWYEPGKIRRRLTMSETEPQLGSISNIQHAVSANLKYRMVM